MARKSFAREERARDLLCGFLVSSERRPLKVFAKLFFAGELPSAFRDATALHLETEVQTHGLSRADIVISSARELLFVEVKVDAAEHLVQYAKYKYFFEQQGFVVTCGALLNKQRTRRKKDNTPFLSTYGLETVYWSEVLEALQKEFGTTSAWRDFRDRLAQIDPKIGTAVPIVGGPPVVVDRSPRNLPTNHSTLSLFYTDLLSRLSEMEGMQWQAGNAPYCLKVGKRSWQELFQEVWFLRVFICLDKKGLQQPSFKFSVMLWDKSWTKNENWFLANKGRLGRYFESLGMDLGRNEGTGWNRRAPWAVPYTFEGLKYANAFWAARVPLSENGEPRDWEVLLQETAERASELARIVDALGEGL